MIWILLALVIVAIIWGFSGVVGLIGALIKILFWVLVGIFVISAIIGLSKGRHAPTS